MINDLPEEFKKAIGTKKIKFGIKSVIKALKLGKAKSVVFASNIPNHLRNDLKYYGKISNAQIMEFNGTNKDLGVKLKRAHSVLAVVLLKKNGK